MAYGDDIDALSPSHTYSFDGNANDGTGSINGTNSGCIFTEAAICEDATNCMTTNGTTDSISLADDNSLNLLDQTRFAFAGWFSPTAIQNPPKRIAGMGGSNTLQILLGWGNALMFEAGSTGTVPYGPIQVYGDNVLTPGRVYHLCMVFEGSSNGNEVRCYLDGVKQLDANPANRQPGIAAHDAATQGFSFGNLSADSYYAGGVLVTMLSPINGRYNEWATWDGANVANLTDTAIREELFEKGALPYATISSDTQANMQTALNAYTGTTLPNRPLCLRIEDVSGGGFLALTADNVKFDALASIHIQFVGVGILGWINLNGSDASIVSTPNGGTAIIYNAVNFTLTGLDNPTEVRIYQAGTDTEITGQEDVTTGTFTDIFAEQTVDIQLISLSKKITRIDGLVVEGDTTIDIVQFTDRVYENP